MYIHNTPTHRHTHTYTIFVLPELYYCTYNDELAAPDVILTCVYTGAGLVYQYSGRE